MLVVGCGKLLWLSANEATVSITASGLVRAKRPGTATIKVFSLFDSINYDEVLMYSSICILIYCYHRLGKNMNSMNLLSLEIKIFLLVFYTIHVLVLIDM